MSETTATAQAKTKKSGAMKWVLIILLVLVVLGGAGGAAAWWFWFRVPAANAEGGAARAPEKGHAKPPGDGIVPMEPFLVNLADKGAQRYVRVTIRLVVDTKEEAKAIEESEVAKTRLRSAVLELLTQQTADALTTPEGKDALKKAIAERSAPVLGGKKVLDVLFTDFVVQF